MADVLYFFGQLDDNDIRWMARSGRIRRLKEGALMIEAGAELHAVFVVLEGRLSVRTGDREITQLQPGEIVGEMSLVDSRPTAADVVAEGMAKVLEIDRPRIVTRLATDPGFASRFYRGVAIALSDRLRTLQTEPEPDAEGDYLSPELLDTQHIAGERFTQLVDSLP